MKSVWPLTCALGVDHPFWDPLPVKVRHLVIEDEVLHEYRAIGPRRHGGGLQPDRGTCSGGASFFGLKYRGWLKYPDAEVILDGNDWASNEIELTFFFSRHYTCIITDFICNHSIILEKYYRSFYRNALRVEMK